MINGTYKISLEVALTGMETKEEAIEAVLEMLNSHYENLELPDMHFELLEFEEKEDIEIELEEEDQDLFDEFTA